MARRALKTTARDLVRANRNLERAAAAAEDKVAAAFLRAEARVFSRVATLLSDAPRFDQAGLDARLRWYFENVPSLEIARENAGYFSAVNSYLDEYPRIGKLAEDVLASGRVDRDFVEIPKDLVDALQKRDLDHFAELNRAALDRLDAQLLDSVVVGSTPANALAEIRGVITGEYPWGQRKGLYEWHAGTYVRTAQMRFSRQILKAKADELGLKWFVYTGPVDEVTRDFCLDLVGTVHSLEEIEEMDNGQTGNVFVDGGGYNCRHDWSPVSDELAKELQEAEAEDEDPIGDEIREQSPEPEPAPAEPAVAAEIPEKPDGWIEAKNIAGAAQHAQDTGLARVADFTGLDVRHANEINRRLAGHMEAFDGFKGQVDFVGSNSGYLKWRTARYRDYWAKQGYSGDTLERLAKRSAKVRIRNAVAYYHRDPVNGRALIFNRAYYGTGSKAANAWEQFATSNEYHRKTYGFNFNVVPTPKGVIDHEIGHAIDNFLAGAGNEMRMWTDVNQEFRELLGNLARRENKPISALLESGYGQTNVHESLAETWASFLNSEKPTPAVRELGELILKKLRERGSVKT